MKSPFQQQVQRQQQQLRRQQEGYHWLQQQEAARRAREQAARGRQAAVGPGAGALAQPRVGTPQPRRRRRPVRATLFFLVGVPVLAWLSLIAYGFLRFEVVFPEGMAAIGALAVALVGFLLVCRWTGRIYRGRRV